MKFDKHVKISIPNSLKEKVADKAAQLGMNTASFVRFILYEAIKDGRVMTSIPTMRCDSSLKFKAPEEFMMHIERQAHQSNIPIGTYIRVLLSDAISKKESENE